MPAKFTEAEVAQAVMEHFSAEGWDCYPEVEIPGGRADIVAVRPLPFSSSRIVHIIETKTSWSLSLLEQALYRRELAHYVSIAAPRTKRYNRLFWILCRDYGIGMMEIVGADPHVQPHRDYPAKLSRGLKSAKKLGLGPWRTLASLHEDQKRFTPGSTASAGYSTAFSRTMDSCADYVRKNPGATVKEIIEQVASHYASKSGFKQGVLVWLEKRFDDIEARREGRCIRFYPTGAPSVQPELLTAERTP